MAEAVVDRQRFYCHQCSQAITPNLPEYTCPRCDSGFIEEMTDDVDVSDENTENDPAAQFAELWGRTFLESFRNHASRERSPPSQSEGESEMNESPGPRLIHPSMRVRFGRGNSRTRSPAIESIVQQLLSSLTGAPMFQRAGLPMNMFSLYGEPGDYAWGAGGLDAIITQLMNQLESTGAPPAPKDQIDKLPTVQITQDQIDKNIQCSVCMEDYKLDEKVRQLPCLHIYHNDCIIPWLQQHGTCPVCRKTLEGKIYTEDPMGMPPGGSSSSSDDRSNHSSPSTSSQ